MLVGGMINGINVKRKVTDTDGPVSQPSHPEKDTDVIGSWGLVIGIAAMFRPLVHSVSRASQPMPAKTSCKSGFTRWEIVIVMVIIVALVALAIPNLVKPRRSLNSCTDRNLPQIEAAKKQWAVEHKQPPTAVPVESDIFGPARYIRALPLCPIGGSYALNAVSAKPTCSKSAAPDFHTF